jgi:hypothetical protein
VVTGEKARLFAFEGSSKNADWSCCNADVSPDGANVAFVQGDGSLVRYEVATKTRYLVARGGLPCRSSSECFGNYFPEWAPTGELILFQRVYFEGGRPFIVKAFEVEEPLVTIGLNRHGDESPAWAPDSKRLCGIATQYSANDFGPPGVHDLSRGQTEDLTDAFISGLSFDQDVTVSYRGCAWAADGHNAFSFEIFGASAPLAGESGRRIAIVAPDGHMVLRTAPGAGEVIAWLPDSSGVVYTQRLDRATQYVLLMLDGGRILLQLQADRLLGIVPD